MKVVAILDRSAGNDTVGEMWQETAVFDESDSLLSVLEWASTKTHLKPGELRSRLTLTIAQEPRHAR